MKEHKDETTNKNNNEQRTSSSFTTDDLVSTKYKRGNRVLCRPSGDKDEKWRTGTVQDIIQIDNREYLSIMSEIDDINNNDIPTFAQYYIPLLDKTRVRPFYHKENRANKNNDHST